MIKNPSKTWSIITILILLILVYFNTCTVYSFKNLASKRALPSKYKNYKVLDSLINDSTFEIKKLLFEPRYYDSIQNTIICTKGDSLYYKLNAKGLIIDSISVKEI